MAIRTGAIFNSLVYGGIDSADYGIYITGEGVYNTPERAVELVSVPGRNGAVAIDQGHWENIEVEYPAGMFGKDQTDFATAISDFRNAICSQLGYQRLTDSYNPNEYRMALYTEGLEVEPVNRSNGTVGEFTIKFNCKPQRWLTSGEDEIEMVTAGSLHNSVTNPTLFDSSPLLAVTGSGTVRIGTGSNHPTDYVITLNDEVVGEIELLPERTYETPFSLDPSQINRSRAYEDMPYALTDAGDTITLSYFKVGVTLRAGTNETLDSVSVSFVGSHGISNYVGTSPSEVIDSRTTKRTFLYGEQTWIKGAGTNTSEDSVSVTCNITQTDPDTGTTTSVTRTVTFIIRLRFASNGNLIIGLYNISTSPGWISKAATFVWGRTTADSTQSVLGNPTYIDCDIGEAYKVVNGELVSLNRYIELGSQLPVLVPGANTVGRDSTTNPTSILLTPRWWKL